MKRAMRRRKTWQRQAAAITAAMMAMSVGGIAYAMPQGEVIRSGKGEVTRQDKDMTVNQDSKRLAIDWAGFDIANDERVTFRQPDRDSVALNRVVGDAASVIDGALSGNGHVYVINPNGVLFGKNASVDVGSLVASTARISDRDMTNFAGADGITMAIPEDSSAKVINAGTIRAEGGLVVLHAAEVENSGTITNPEGTTALAAARNLSLSADTAGKINFTVDGALAKAKALNSGMLKADGGYLVMTARSAGDVMSTVVNNTGTMEAKTLRQNEKGEILLDGGDNGVVELSGTIDASGMEAGQSAGSIKAIGAETHVKDGANLLAKGNVDGGLIETSGDYLEISDKANIDAAGETGKAGEWLLDPTNVVINDTGSSEVQSENNRYTNGTTYIKTSSIVNVLKSNNVKIQAIDRDYGNADITLDSALKVDQTTTGRNTLTLESQGDVNINAAINATSPLNVVLNADSDGNDKGGVNINADIRTGGGSLTTGANGATFFGSTQEGEAKRVIETAGGAVNIQNEARLQLNGGTLSINTSGGNVTFAKNVASMNKYEAFMDHDFVDFYEGNIHAWTEQAQAWEKMLQSIYGKKYTESDGTTKTFAIARGYKIVANYSDLTSAEKIRLSNALAQTWELANLAATQGNRSDPDGKQLNGMHLVTITDKYENSAAMANAVKKNGAVLEYFTGGKETTNMSASRTSGRQFAWVTGPEKGTTFYISSGIGQGSDQNGMYTNWVQGGNGYSEPNNNNGLTKQPYVAIGWTDENGWDDVHNGASTIHGFIRETELPNSALSINSGAGAVTVGTKGTANTGKLGSDVGTGLRNVSIKTTTGDVKVLDSIYVHDNNTNAASDLANGNVKITTQGNVDVGKITSDKKVEISSTGAEKHVNVNGKIATDGLVSIESADDITVHGIQNADKIRLVSTDANGDGAITLANNTDGSGALITSSNANDAVVIDARGTNGSFHNNTTAAKAITTGTGGNWKVYSYSPDADEFGTNLNSGTNAQWGATSTSYSASQNDDNKYIFQVQPTVYVTANDMTKVYGEELTNDNVTTTTEATFVGQDENEHNVNEYTNAFNEGDVADYYNGSGTFTSKGWAKTATRTGGDKAPASEPENNAIYNIEAASDNYNLTDKGKASGYKDATTKDGGTVEILRRQINVNGSGNQTYGNATINDWTLTATLTGKQKGVPSDADAIVNDDKLDESTDHLSIKSGSSYAENQNGRTTANASPDSYEDAVNMVNVGFENGAGVNYEIVNTQGDLKVDKANLTIQIGNASTVYGTKFDESQYGYNYASGITNGDTEETLNAALGGMNYTNDAALDGTDGKWTKGVGDYALKGEGANGLKNYKVTYLDGTATVTPLNITEDNVNNFITNATYTTVYGSKADFGKAVFTGVNGDGTRDLSITGSSALTGNTEGVITKDAAENAYDTVVSLDGLSAQDKKNYGLEDTSSFTFDKSATVEKADLTVTRKGIETVYGTVKTDDGTMTTYTDLVNGDTDDIAIDNGNYGTAYNDELTKTNNVGKYNYKATLNSESDVLRNYNVHDAGTNYVDIKPLNITEDNVNDFITNATYTTVYGTKADFGKAVFTGVNGDGTRDLSITGSSALTGNTEGVITKDAAKNAYDTVVSLDGLSAQDKKNYGLEDTSSFTFDKSATVEKADLTVTRKGIETVYGTVKTDDGTMTTYTDLVNGDADDIAIDNGNYGTAYNDDLTKTNNVGKYDYKATLNSESDVLRNYNVHDDGTNYVNITPYTITEEEIVNPDGSPLYTTKYGQKDPFGKATFTGVNGDGTLLLDITDSSALTGAADGRITENVGDNIYDTTVSLESLQNKNYQFADGATSKTFDNTASVTPADLTIETKDVETEYGTVKTTTSEVKGLVNGDLPTGFLFDYGDYGGAYLDGNTKTNDVNTYHFGTDLSGADFLNNYTITGGEADVKIDPKDVTFFVSGTGNTLADVTYTVDPDIDAQLAYGEHVDADYTPGNDLGSNQYGVVAHINGTPIVTGDVAGNYRYNYGGLITLSPTVPTKPDIDPHNPSNVDGSGSWTSNMGNHGVPGVERVAGLASAELPFFKVEAGQVSHYGTYDVAADPDKVRLEPTGKRLPEPNQPKTQYREYTKALTTTDGTGMFRMVYDGSVFRITPTDDAALALVRTGDVKNNVELSAEALHAGFSEMGILLEDLDGVYVHFENLH